MSISHPSILTYDDLIAIPSGESPEPLTDVRHYDPTIIAAYEKPDMLPYTGEYILVRQTVAQKLALASQQLRQYSKHLKVAYGYRHPAVQETYYRKRFAALREQHPELTAQELTRRTHDFVAVPEVAGHPTGGALDLTLADKNGQPLDMGTAIADFSDPEKIRSFSQNLTPEQESNRHLLHDTLASHGFAPFYGEWWHYSYGDREWACFYQYPRALYGPITLAKKNTYNKGKKRE